MIVLAVCEWTAWSPWSTCTATCDGGMKTRERTYTPPDVECEGADEQSEACGVEPCGGNHFAVYFSVDRTASIMQ